MMKTMATVIPMLAVLLAVDVPDAEAAGEEDSCLKLALRLMDVNNRLAHTLEYGVSTFETSVDPCTGLEAHADILTFTLPSGDVGRVVGYSFGGQSCIRIDPQTGLCDTRSSIVWYGFNGIVAASCTTPDAAKINSGLVYHHDGGVEDQICDSRP